MTNIITITLIILKCTLVHWDCQLDRKGTIGPIILAPLILVFVLAELIH